MYKAVFLLSIVLIHTNAQAGLMQSWHDALANDPGYQSALAERDFGVEEFALARAQLLPQVSVTGSQGQGRTDIIQTSLSSFRKYDTETWAIQLRQTLFRARTLAGYGRGEALAKAAEARLVGARQSMAARLIETAGQLALANADIANAEIALATARQVLNVSIRQLRAGETTRREQIRARSRLAKAKQDLSAAFTVRAAAEANWRAMTGQVNSPHFHLPDDLSDRLSLSSDIPDNLIANALSNNPALAAARFEVEAAKYGLKQAQGDRLPSLELIASRSFSDSDTDNTIGSAFDTTRVFIQANIPLFTGGTLSAAIRQAQARLKGAQASLSDLIARASLVITRDIASLKQAQNEASRALADRETGLIEQRSAELGKLAGTATVIDIADAENLKAQAQRDLVQANASALVAWARVQDAIGQLDEDALVHVSHLAGWN